MLFLLKARSLFAARRRAGVRQTQSGNDVHLIFLETNRRNSSIWQPHRHLLCAASSQTESREEVHFLSSVQVYFSCFLEACIGIWDGCASDVVFTVCAIPLTMLLMFDLVPL